MRAQIANAEHYMLRFGSKLWRPPDACSRTRPMHSKREHEIESFIHPVLARPALAENRIGFDASPWKFAKATL
jgi:hypothetical protein